MGGLDFRPVYWEIWVFRCMKFKLILDHVLCPDWTVCCDWTLSQMPNLIDMINDVKWMIQSPPGSSVTLTDGEQRLHLPLLQGQPPSTPRRQPTSIRPPPTTSPDVCRHGGPSGRSAERTRPGSRLTPLHLPRSSCRWCMTLISAGYELASLVPWWWWWWWQRLMIMMQVTLEM